MNELPNSFSEKASQALRYIEGLIFSNRYDNEIYSDQQTADTDLQTEAEQEILDMTKSDVIHKK